MSEYKFFSPESGLDKVSSVLNLYVTATECTDWYNALQEQEMKRNMNQPMRTKQLRDGRVLNLYLQDIVEAHILKRGFAVPPPTIVNLDIPSDCNVRNFIIDYVKVALDLVNPDTYTYNVTDRSATQAQHAPWWRGGWNPFAKGGGFTAAKTSQKVKLTGKGDRCVYKDASGAKFVRLDGRYVSLQTARKQCTAAAAAKKVKEKQKTPKKGSGKR